MSTDLVPASTGYTLSPAEYALLEGDLSKLSEESRLTLYNNVCTSLGLNPMTAPFGYIRLSGKLTLYAKKDCTDQLRRIHGVSITDLIGRELNGVYIVTAKAQDKTGRTDVATGAVSLDGLKSEALCNGLMKTETKAKRRVTLSICGLGMLDESEASSIPGAQMVAHSPILHTEQGRVNTQTGEITEAPPSGELDPLAARRLRCMRTFKEHFDPIALEMSLPPAHIRVKDGRIQVGATFAEMSEADLDTVEEFMARPDAPVKPKEAPTPEQSAQTVAAVSA